MWVQLMIPIMGKSVGHMLDKWSLMSNSGKVELEVSDWFQNLTEEVITRTIFGSSYDDGKKIYQLQAKQIVFAAESFQKVFFPGHGYVILMLLRTHQHILLLLLLLLQQQQQQLCSKVVLLSTKHA